MQCPLCKSDISVYPVVEINGESIEWCGSCDGIATQRHDLRIYAQTEEEILETWRMLGQNTCIQPEIGEWGEIILDTQHTCGQPEICGLQWGANQS